MKKTILFIAIIIALASCDSTKGITETATKYSGPAASILTTLSPNSNLADIAKLFTALDTNKDKSISTTEAVGAVADNFNILDKDKSKGIDIDELGALLGLLK